METVPSSQVSLYVGKIQAIKKGRIVNGVYVGGILHVLSKNDYAMTLLKKAFNKRRRVVALFVKNGSVTQVNRLVVSPKAEHIRPLKREYNAFCKGEITLHELLGG